ncbi:AGC/GRK protein kinase [Saprolegnia parasitica CBS 223.65]|uniref:AGC/GRK protein kinase n=1 Tax=Saprolegnia parasitica (strain CBS 223.65) TaxID=695850 RepID=A0A067C3T6_SAPPC|nr:AGC/GRK protein kinase [Saprolegnia parasitica CBS 223.65]KDO25459.1 AGC/GRK protein kinase [Saprolegnia parasitica CBS 223.65]|eukprot:XP_012203885.1 AGC/GRK protein kinase [Saprolegnia parasitica CBS 223.65]
MDELQDAIQDAQYIGAMVDPRPRPTIAFYTPSPTELADFIAKQNRINAEWLGVEALLSQPLGFYLFHRYCEAEAHGVEKLVFLMDVHAFRNIPQHNRQLQKAKAIYKRYCDEASTVLLQPVVLKEPPPAAPKAPGEANFAWKKEFKFSLADGTQLYMSYKNDAHVLGVAGPILTAIRTALDREEENAMDSDAKSSMDVTLFHQLEACVIGALDVVHMAGFRASSFYNRLVQFLYLQSREIGEDDFSLLRVLGRGGFGMVNGTIKRNTGKLYALKAMNKKIIKKKHAEKLCLAERAILTMLSSPFVVCLKYAFQTKEDLYLVLDLRTGGDLSFHLNRGRFTEEQVMFWAAQILLGLQHMHENNIVYRDLKPENILLDDKGNCSISDLGLAVEVTPNLCGRCGTRGYWAPEMLLRDSQGNRLFYDQAVDWWSYGCVVYEMLYGKCPFRTSKAKALHADKQKPTTWQRSNSHPRTTQSTLRRPPPTSCSGS